MYALLNEHKNIWLNLHRSVPLSSHQCVISLQTQQCLEEQNH